MIQRISTLLILFCCISLNIYAQHGARDTAKTVPPIKMFDNLYYIGIDWVSSYLLVTDDGLIVIDALYGKYSNHILKSVRELGFDPKDIKYVLCTHGHYDHNEGAAMLKKETGARVGMTEADWDMTEGKIDNPYPSIDAPISRDLVIKDGDVIKLGKTTLKFYVTPGHTPGVLSFSFPVKEGGNTYNAFGFGGAGLNFEGVKRTQMYIKSVDRVLGMKDLLQVNVSNHPSTGKVLERGELLKQRKAGEKNPFVSPEDFQAWLKDMRAQAEKKLTEEKAKGVE
jgi:metallo-beta-lactamase class B